ncbi:MAG: ArnT family glycosyltransferase [Cyclobacteriaceae bacterium]
MTKKTLAPSQYNTTYRILQVLCLLIVPFALFYNLGLTAVHADEGTRGIVSLEMILSGNYLVPTINSDFYYNKPPLYNWIVVGFIKLFGFSEFTLRLPTVLSLIGFAATIYFFARKKVGEKVAFLAAMGLITCGRILFYDSFHGLIDMLFSWLTFVGFICTYHFFGKKNWVLLFVTTYLITAAGVMMKGLPSLVFQSFTLLAYFSFQGQFKKLFHWAHIVSVGLLVLLVGSYFYVYNEYNDILIYFETLLTESTKRAAFLDKENSDQLISNRLINTVVFMVGFPFSILAVMMPWGLLAVFCIRKDIIQRVKSHPLIWFAVVTFLVNIIVYWLSPMTKPRYLFMLFPLLLLIFGYFYYENTVGKLKRVMDTVFAYMLYSAPFLVLATLFIPDLLGTPSLWVICTFFFSLLLALAIYYRKVKTDVVFFVVVLLLVCRSFFGLVILPERANGSYTSVVTRVQGKEVGRLSKGVPLYRVCNNIMSGDTYLDHDISMYITHERQENIKLSKDWDIPNAYFIVNRNQLKQADFEVIYPFETKWKRGSLTGENDRFLVKLKK